MKRWTGHIFPVLMGRSSKDEFYQRILRDMRAAEKDYIRIQKSLDKRERRELDDYIALCEELQFQLVRIDYEYGWERGYERGNGD